MLKFFRNWCGIFFLSALFILMPMTIMAKDVGHFTQVEGNVELFNPQKTQPILAKPQTGVQLSDRIKTEALARAQLQFLDASTMTISPRSDIVIESYMFNSKTGEQSSLSKLTQGLVRLIVPVTKLEKKEFLVKTTTAIMGIRGTEVYILIGPEFTDVFVKTGSVAVSPNKDTAGGGKQSSLTPESLRYFERLTRQASIRAQIWGQLLVSPMIVSPLQALRTTLRGLSAVINIPPGSFQTLNAALANGLPPNNVMSNTSGPLGMVQAIQQSLPPAATTGPGGDAAPPGPPASGMGTGGIGGGGGGGGGVASPAS
jgi:hypothetical protein